MLSGGETKKGRKKEQELNTQELLASTQWCHYTESTIVRL